MRVHHLNCGTMRPPTERLIAGSGSLVRPGLLVAHCLAVETEGGIVLVDTGFGLESIKDPGRLLGPNRFFVRPILDPAETAVRQLQRLGLDRGDVRHVVLTHMDFDHAAGLADFPDATVHVLRDEHDSAMRRATANEKGRYVPAQWAHGPRWSIHERDGERWNGFESVRALGGGDEPEILLIPLFGHTRGHCAVAVQVDDGWQLHCGDAYFFHGEMDVTAPRCTPGLSMFQELVAVDRKARRANRDRLLELARRERGATLRMFCAHDPTELAGMDERAAEAVASA